MQRGVGKNKFFPATLTLFSDSVKKCCSVFTAHLEWTAGYIELETGNYQTYGGNLKRESNEYKSKYAGVSDKDIDNYNEIANTTRKGDAIWETSNSGSGSNSWNGGYSCFMHTTC